MRAVSIDAEFRWYHGQIVRPEPLWLGAFLFLIETEDADALCDPNNL